MVYKVLIHLLSWCTYRMGMSCLIVHYTVIHQGFCVCERPVFKADIQSRGNPSSTDCGLCAADASLEQWDLFSLRPASLEQWDLFSLRSASLEQWDLFSLRSASLEQWGLFSLRSASKTADIYFCCFLLDGYFQRYFSSKLAYSVMLSAVLASSLCDRVQSILENGFCSL